MFDTCVGWFYQFIRKSARKSPRPIRKKTSCGRGNQWIVGWWLLLEGMVAIKLNISLTNITNSFLVDDDDKTLSTTLRVNYYLRMHWRNWRFVPSSVKFWLSKVVSLLRVSSCLFLLYALLQKEYQLLFFSGRLQLFCCWFFV